MDIAQGQFTLLKVWADGTDFIADATKSPKAEFARLAKTKGWVGGGNVWCMHWEACFGETYPYTGMTSTPPVAPKPQKKSVNAPAPAPGLGDRMRRLSISSGASSYSVISNCSSFSNISGVPTVQSLNSQGSIAGGLELPQEQETASTEHEASSNLQEDVKNSASTSSKKTKIVLQGAQQSHKQTKAAPFWYRFSNFVPEPTATFKHEFWRLATHQGWDKDQKYQFKVEALNADIAFHYGANMEKLHRWQELCAEVPGINEIPKSITKCKKALKTVWLDIYSLIDHERCVEAKIILYKSFSEFRRRILAGGTFPRQCANEDGFISIFLKHVF